MIKALIIDDEKLARDVILAYLKNHSDIEVVEECANGFDGVKAVNKYIPDLVFLDVQMPKLTGFEMLELLDRTPVVIFSTAYDEFALKAFEKSAADYLLKPYAQSRFDEAISKARQRLKEGDTELISKIQESRADVNEELDRLVVRVGSKIVIISLDKVDYIEAQDDYVAIHSEGKKYLKQLTMKYLEASLPKNQFVRVHRSFIVSINSIDRLEAMSKDSYLAILKTGNKISVSRSGYTSLKGVLNF
ncbi:LytTR family transcriptional regulator DNA-binding domain-containing protein [Fulvivirga sp. 29W222]|uniref:LytTR family transcriptional regulator DNA-binding domain-containing protein n=1 Tax=Fulvivirga marina TaxID=2494733 RepID=A0A937FUD9_9BACT|nr:LytTR family transcriptional regulator DNA-binding domain-containing protein [Fulvivirga marina]MBL6446064.1 LytTR family transcriptional regulator DNA-binding domain-containing protein [Fulvivirga marina]